MDDRSPDASAIVYGVVVVTRFEYQRGAEVEVSSPGGDYSSACCGVAKPDPMASLIFDNLMVTD